MKNLVVVDRLFQCSLYCNVCQCMHICACV